MSLSPMRWLAGLIGVLALVLAGEWLLPPGGPEATRLPAARLARAAAHQDLPARDTSDWGDTVLERPLFSISRRPPKPVPVSKGGTIAGQARLAGIMITRAGRHAIFAPDGGGKEMVLAEGASVNDSTISQIAPGFVKLASGTVLKPAFDHNRATPAPVFQPQPPAFPNPAFERPGFPQPPGFQPPSFQPAPFQPGLQNQPFQPPGIANGDTENGQPINQPPVFHGPVIPQRRE